MDEALLIKNPFAVLGVHRQSSPEEVKAAYYKLAQAHHPDKGGAAEAFTEVKDAYRLLTDRRLLSVWLKFNLTIHKGCFYCKARGTTIRRRGIGGPSELLRCTPCHGSGLIIKPSKNSSLHG